MHIVIEILKIGGIVVALTVIAAVIAVYAAFDNGENPFQ
jgi:hypothetical protein